MDKNIIKEELNKLTELNVSGERVTKRAQKGSADANKAYYKDVEKKMKELGKHLDQEDENKIETPKINYKDSEKEYHDEMEIRNGQEMIKYDSNPNKKFTERAIKAIEGDSTMGNKTYTGDENGNTQSVWGASDDEFGKKLVKTIKAANKKRDDSTPSRHQFGDDIEVAEGDPKVKTKNIAVEGMKRIKFKKPFDGVGNAIKLIPEAFRVNERVFELTDGNEKYKVKWEGSLTEGKAIILEASDKNMVNEAYNKIKYLMNYNSEDTLGALDGKARVQENHNIKAGISQGFTNEESVEVDETTLIDGDWEHTPKDKEPEYIASTSFEDRKKAYQEKNKK
jgi:hypothetical protein